MAEQSNKTVEEKLAALRQSYFDALPDKLNHIQQLWEAVIKDNDAQDNLRDLQHATHTLAGSGATFGAEGLSRLSKEIELQICATKGDPSCLDEAARLNITKLITKLFSESDSLVKGKKKIAIDSYASGTKEGRVVSVVVEDQELAGLLDSELGKAGYQLELFADLDAFRENYQQLKPDAVIIDMDSCAERPNGKCDIKPLTQLHQPSLAVFFISSRNDIKTRLTAARAGAHRYFTKPLNINKLLQSLGGLTDRSANDPYRVLIVDDDEELAAYYATLLNAAEIQTSIISNPLLAIDELEAWQPDLIMMDVYMPNCSGLELAAIIRQDEKYTTTPIVFLSSERDVNKQLYALDLGGDAFLTKPVEQQQLLATVIARVKRSRWLLRLQHELELSLQHNERQRKEIEEKEERLRSSQYFAGIGTWDLNLNSRQMYWSEKIAPLLGYEEEVMTPSYEAFIAAIHLDDKDRVISELESCVSQGGEFDIEHRIVWPDGSIRWLMQKGNVIRESGGQAVRMLGAVQDTTRRKQLERDLATQNEFAVQANRAKSEFLSRMSHELRTPLNAIIGFAQLLEADVEQPLVEHQHDNLNEILKAANHLLDLIDEVLDLAKIEAGKIQLNIEELSIEDILLESYSMMIPMAENNQIQIEFLVDGCEHIFVSADRTKLKQVIFNLVSNAIKYNRPNGSVTVSCEVNSEHRIRINVQDTGKGIPLERQSELFKAFSRLGAETTDVEGTGIGLMISKKIIEMMGGELGFYSEPGKGSNFWLELSTLQTIRGEAKPQLALS